MGYCAGNDRLGFGRRGGSGFGGGFGQGFGRGYRRGWTDFQPQETRRPEYSDSINELVEEAALLRDRLAVLEERLADQKNKD